jgi:hypothetical protein
MAQTKKDFFRLRFLGTTPQPCATGEKSQKNLCAEKGSLEKRGNAIFTEKIVKL